MRVISARNVHQALPRGIEMLQRMGVRRDSRNGPVLQAPWPVVTVYARPEERLVFWGQRDVNTAFLVYEALWMLGGRRDLAPLTRYIKDFGRFSDDGQTLHGAYGYRWRHHFGGWDQLPTIIERLKKDPDDRRSVLAMWDPRSDLGSTSKDVPCNDTVTFQCNPAGALDMTVFCRSNDIVWGAYFANAFHFGLLHDYMAAAIGCAIGEYRQISVNYHAYVETIQPLESLVLAAYGGLYAIPTPVPCPYRDGTATAVRINAGIHDHPELDWWVARVLSHADSGSLRMMARQMPPWFQAARAVLQAHEQWRTGDPPYRYEDALATLAEADSRVDMVQSMRAWLQRRYDAWLSKQKTLEVTS